MERNVLQSRLIHTLTLASLLMAPLMRAQQIMVRFQVGLPKGHFVTDLRQDEIELREDGQAQSIVKFEGGAFPTTVPNQVILVFDAAGAFRRERPLDPQVFSKLLDPFPNVRISIYSLGDHLKRCTGPTRDLQELDKAMRAILQTPASRYWDYPRMLQAAADGISAGETRVLVPFSQSIGSRELGEQVIRQAREIGVAIYPAILPFAPRVTYPNERPQREGFSNEEANAANFSRLASGTGGQELRSRVIGDDFLPAVFDDLAKQLKFDYVAGFMPTPRSAQPQKHQVQIVLKSRARGEVLGGVVTIVH